jgi:hypothetical protein
MPHSLHLREALFPQTRLSCHPYSLMLPLVLSNTNCNLSANRDLEYLLPALSSEDKGVSAMPSFKFRPPAPRGA